MKQSEQHFRKLVEHSSDVIMLLDADGRVTFSTDSLRPTLGYAPEKMIGRGVLELIHPDDRRAAEPLFRDVLQITGRAAKADLRVQHNDGLWRDLAVVAVNRLDDPAISAFVVNYRDVTEHMRLEREVLQAQKMAAVGRLAGGVAHDFNNLLTVILGSMELLLEMLPAGHPGREEADEARKAALRAAALSRQVLDALDTSPGS